MIVILCIDDNNGMMFNYRRQSQDKKLREHILNLISPNGLWMNSYSGKQFTDTDSKRLFIDDCFLDKIRTGDYCFIENTDISPYIEDIEKIILFKWNRNYPADTFFTIDLSEWILEEKEEFAGYSHDKITKEIYSK